MTVNMREGFLLIRRNRMGMGELLLLLLMPLVSAAFNLDTDSAVVYQGEGGSLFGFSVAAHRDQGRGW